MTRIWISIQRVAELLGVKRRHVFRRLKRGDFETRAGAMSGNKKRRREILLESLPAEARAKYFAELAVGQKGEKEKGQPAGAALTPSLSQIMEQSEDVVARNNEKADAMRRIETAKNQREAIGAAARQFGVSERTVERWYKNFRVLGAAAFKHKKRSDAGGSKVVDERVVARVRLLYLQPFRPTITEVHKQIAKDFEMSGLKAPSYQTVRRIGKSIEPDLVARYRYGEREFDDKFCYITLRKKPPLPRQWVQCDHHPCDHNVVFPNGAIGRPWITAFYDLCTNEIVGFQLTREKPVGEGTYPGAAAIGLALRITILKKSDPRWPSSGLFDNLHSDLGKDFRSQYVRAVCADLGVNIRYTRGYHGKSKSNIEGWFGIMENGTRHLPGYCGNKPENNPERQKLKPEPLDPKTLLSIDEYESRLQDWILNDYHHQPSRALGGISPLEALASHIEQGFSVRSVRDERVLDLLLMRRASRLVKNFGIEAFGTHGRRRFFMAPELLPLIGQRVDICWDPAKLGEIYIYQGARFVGIATNRELIDFGASEQTLRREREIKHEQRRSVAERHKQLLMRAQYPTELAQADAETRYEKVVQEEREKIAVNAMAPAVTTLLPKFAAAAKALREVKGQEDKTSSAELRDRAGRRDDWDDLPASDSYVQRKPVADIYDSLPSSDEYFSRRKREAWDDDEPLKSSEDLFKPDGCAPPEPQGEQICDNCGEQSDVASQTTLCWPCSKRLCTKCLNSPEHRCET